LTQADVNNLRSLYDTVANGEIDIADTNVLEYLVKLEKEILKLTDSLALISRTAKLWLQYIKYVNIIKDFIRAERTGDWNLHLLTVSRMLNLFAATGHNNYTKCSRLYLQMMVDLPHTHPWLNDKFVNQGFHTVRRSNRYWAALSTDLLIEQIMMKSLKGRGGLTHVRGMTESVCLLSKL